MLSVPEAIGWILIVGLVLWIVRVAIHAEIDRWAYERHKRTQHEAALHVLEDAPEGEDDDNR